MSLWVDQSGLLTDEPVAGAELLVDGGWILPGLVDAHCHIGLGPEGAVTLEEADAQARTDRDAGTLLLRDCGSPLDTTPLQARDDLPEIIRAGRHLARPKRYIRGLSIDLDDPGVAARARRRAGRGGRRLGQARGRLDRQGPRRPGPALARRRAGGRHRRRARGGRAGHRARVRHRRAARPDQRGHRLHRARHRAHRRPDRRDGPPRHRAGPHADQRGDVPRHRRLRLALPGLRRAHARAARGRGRRRPARRSRPGCRSTRAPTRAGRSRTA